MSQLETFLGNKMAAKVTCVDVPEHNVTGYQVLAISRERCQVEVDRLLMQAETWCRNAMFRDPKLEGEFWTSRGYIAKQISP